MLIINIDNKYKFNFNLPMLSKKVVKELLSMERVIQDISVDISLVGLKKIRTINKYMRGIDKTTDVLSFPNISFNNPSDFKSIIKNKKLYSSVFDYSKNCFYLGDIVICYDKILSQSKKYGHSLKREYVFLLVHSMLHLLGYDHINTIDEMIMFDKQNIVLSKLNILR